MNPFSMSEEALVNYCMKGFQGSPGTIPKEIDAFGVLPEEYREYFQILIPIAQKMLKEQTTN